MKTHLIRILIPAAALAILWTAAEAAAPKDDPAPEKAKTVSKSQPVIPAELLTATDTVPLYESVPSSEPSVNISEEYKFESRQNIDSFLGEFENPYAAPENTYEGSRSEYRQEDGRPGQATR